jgi:hypothetical protein
VNLNVIYSFYVDQIFRKWVGRECSDNTVHQLIIGFREALDYEEKHNSTFN